MFSELPSSRICLWLFDSIDVSLSSVIFFSLDVSSLLMIHKGLLNFWYSVLISNFSFCVFLRVYISLLTSLLVCCGFSTFFFPIRAFNMYIIVILISCLIILTSFSYLSLVLMIALTLQNAFISLPLGIIFSFLLKAGHVISGHSN